MYEQILTLKINAYLSRIVLFLLERTPRKKHTCFIHTYWFSTAGPLRYEISFDTQTLPGLLVSDILFFQRDMF
jgi:energy-converting hydrogenase Eha subunit F